MVGWLVLSTVVCSVEKRVARRVGKMVDLLAAMLAGKTAVDSVDDLVALSAVVMAD